MERIPWIGKEGGRGFRACRGFLTACFLGGALAVGYGNTEPIMIESASEPASPSTAAPRSHPASANLIEAIVIHEEGGVMLKGPEREKVRIAPSLAQAARVLHASLVPFIGQPATSDNMVQVARLVQHTVEQSFVTGFTVTLHCSQGVLDCSLLKFYDPALHKAVKKAAPSAGLSASAAPTAAPNPPITATTPPSLPSVRINVPFSLTDLARDEAETQPSVKPANPYAKNPAPFRSRSFNIDSAYPEVVVGTPPHPTRAAPAQTFSDASFPPVVVGDGKPKTPPALLQPAEPPPTEWEIGSGQPPIAHHDDVASISTFPEVEIHSPPPPKKSIAVAVPVKKATPVPIKQTESISVPTSPSTITTSRGYDPQRQSSSVNKEISTVALARNPSPNSGSIPAVTAFKVKHILITDKIPSLTTSFPHLMGPGPIDLDITAPINGEFVRLLFQPLLGKGLDADTLRESLDGLEELYAKAMQREPGDFIAQIPKQDFAEGTLQIAILPVGEDVDYMHYTTP